MILLQFTLIKKIPRSLQARFGTQPPLVPHIANTDLSSATKTLFSVPETYGSPSQERVYVEDCSDKEDLEEEQLDFTISNDDCERPSNSPSQPFAKHLSPVSVDGVRQDTTFIDNTSKTQPVSGRWSDLFSFNRRPENCSKLMHFSNISAAKSCSLLHEDLDYNYDVWK